MDESIPRNLDTQHRILKDIEHNLDALSAGDDAPPPDIEVPGGQLSYEALTESNDRLRAERGWNHIDLDAALTAEQRELFAQWQMRHRIRWSEQDLLVVGFAGAVGAAATWFDMALDTAVMKALGKLGDTDLLQGWERDSNQLPIDYRKHGVGGPGHRLRSAGHDIARPLEALRQIRDREFRGTRWVHGVAEPISATESDFRVVDSWADALVLWVKHLVTDFVTPMGLPLPGLSYLYELDNFRIHNLARVLYQGKGRGPWINLRSGMLTPTLSVLSTEAILRTEVHGRAYQRDGSFKLTAGEEALQTELLLAAHSLVGAVSLGKTVASALLTHSGPLAIRHLNIPVLLRIGWLAVSAVADEADRRSSGAPTWEELLSDCAQPWQLESALAVERVAARRTIPGTIET